MITTERSAPARAGLFTTAREPIPLAGVSIDADISAFCARVSVAQRYINREDKPIEVIYVFPLDEGAAVCGFEAIVDGTLVVGEVKEREEAFRAYDEAMEQGHGAFLLDEERPDVFQASVGNLPPGKEVLLKLTYVTELTVEGPSLRFSIPTTVSPRYAPAADRAGVGRPDSETLNPPVAWRVPYGLNLSIRVAMAGRIERIESPSHPISVATNGDRADVTLSQRDAALDRDFVLAMDATGLDRPHAWTERDESGVESIAVAFVPTLGTATIPCEVIFLVDRSGSMGGTSIDEVRNALQLCLRSMMPGCAFNIVGFGSTHEMLFSESRAYDESSLAQASAHVAALDADLGGTEILPALESVLGLPRHAGLSRQVVILTDGEVTNTDAVLALARAHAADARLFTFGIGAGASHHLVKGLARAGGGVAEFIYPGERIEPKVVRQFGRLLSPALTNVRVDWSGLDVTQAPSAPPPVFSGGRMLVYGLMKHAPTATQPSAVTLTANSPAGRLTFSVEIDHAKAAAGSTVATLAARARIRELEESPEWTRTRGSRQHGRKASAGTQEIIALSTRYGLISRETSFVAIERRETPVQGDIQLRRVPIALTSGWGGIENMRIGGLHRAMSAMPASSGATAFGSALTGQARALTLGVGDALITPRRRFGVAGRSDRRSAAVAHSGSMSVPAPLTALVSLQHADGSWELTRELADVIGRDASELETAIAAASGNRRDARRAWATALALVWLRTNARDVEDQWRLLAAKARQWLDGVAAVPPGGGTWIDAAATTLGSS